MRSVRRTGGLLFGGIHCHCVSKSTFMPSWFFARHPAAFVKISGCTCHAKCEARGLACMDFRLGSLARSARYTNAILRFIGRFYEGMEAPAAMPPWHRNCREVQAASRTGLRQHLL